MSYNLDLKNIYHEESFPVTPPEPSKKKGLMYFFVFVLVVFAIVFGTLFSLISPPEVYRANLLVEIPSGHSLSEIALLLKNESVIRSPLLFKILVQHYGKEKGIISGTYLFKEPSPLVAVARRMALGERGVSTIRVTIPEGMTNKDMSVIFEKSLASFRGDQYLLLAKGSEGYQFPDTYFFFSTATSGQVYTTLRENFESRTAELHAESDKLGKNWNDVLTMASLLEGEAVTKEDRRIVSGILWNRIKINMRLQVDAPFLALLGKGSLQLSRDDLAVDSPYNTYTHYGLPPTPISNPGLDTIDAALHPISTKYIFYLSDGDGLMHYAKTFEEHKKNKSKYLR